MCWASKAQPCYGATTLNDLGSQDYFAAMCPEAICECLVVGGSVPTGGIKEQVEANSLGTAFKQPVQD